MLGMLRGLMTKAAGYVCQGPGSGRGTAGREEEQTAKWMAGIVLVRLTPFLQVLHPKAKLPSQCSSAMTHTCPDSWRSGSHLLPDAH